jgi:predicted hotdog family 3-hydroxylacyl-ACP dehydratase
MGAEHQAKQSLNTIDFTDVASLLPHSGAMVLLDKVIDFHELGLKAELTVRNDGLLCSDAAKIPAWAGIEYMAQAIAAYIGIQAKLAGEPIKLGYLLGTRRYNSNIAAFPVGTVLTVHIEKIIQDDKLGVFDCKINGDGIEVNANLNVYQPPTDVILKKYAE